MDNYANYEQELQKAVKDKELADKRLLFLENFIMSLTGLTLFAVLIFISVVQMSELEELILMIIGIVPFLAGAFYSLKLEQIAGYYKCAKCGHCHVPTYMQVLNAPHIGRTRHLKCPECNQKSWNKKVITKE